MTENANRKARWHEELVGSSCFYKRSELSDVIFVFPFESHVELPGHRILLSLRSESFKRAFEKSCTSKPTARTRLPIKIIVKDTKPSVFEALLKFIYTNELPSL